MPTDQELLYFCPASLGGIANYAHHQARALGRHGVDVVLLCPPDYMYEADGYTQRRELQPRPVGASSRWRSRLGMARAILKNARVLAEVVRRTPFSHVLMATYSEYLAPLWAWRLRALQRRGIIFGAIVHDPVRDYQVGPAWWHRHSISAGYSFLSEAFLHEALDLDTGSAKPALQRTVIPHGPYPLPAPDRSRGAIRDELAVPEAAMLFLSFGHIRNGKNLDLVLRALAKIPEAYLLIAGGEASPGQRQSSEYRKLANSLGVGNRCRWVVHYVEGDEAANYFEASDVVLATYSAAFRSASGVLNSAASARRPVLASAGPGPLASVLGAYEIGTLVPPDDLAAIEAGMRLEMGRTSPCDWSTYLIENSWQCNAQRIRAAMWRTPPATGTTAKGNERGRPAQCCSS